LNGHLVFCGKLENIPHPRTFSLRILAFGHEKTAAAAAFAQLFEDSVQT
jgi:hypothetical protein